MKTNSFTARLALMFALACAPFAAAPAADADKGAALAAAVKQAIEKKDAGALDKLVYWEGASDSGKSFFKILLQTALEMKPETVEVVPLPEGKTGPPTTMTVTHLLRITAKEGGDGPSRQSFPVGEKDGQLYLAAAKDAPAGFSP